LDGKEFIYKEPKLTHLYALTERLKASCIDANQQLTTHQTFYGAKFGEIIVFPDSGRVDRTVIDPNKCYLQISHVEPYYGEVFMITFCLRLTEILGRREEERLL
jgi:hypothetical protein